ncbi:hypothetical protein BJ742DRAFT_742397 [Cladochytrium replicatum]|nr:hypothetical protein BJ742DRAFT_742397 [Cladochytrium replicatum]
MGDDDAQSKLSRPAPKPAKVRISSAPLNKRSSLGGPLLPLQPLQPLPQLRLKEIPPLKTTKPVDPVNSGAAPLVSKGSTTDLSKKAGALKITAASRENLTQDKQRGSAKKIGAKAEDVKPDTAKKENKGNSSTDPGITITIDAPTKPLDAKTARKSTGKSVSEERETANPPPSNDAAFPMIGSERDIEVEYQSLATDDYGEKSTTTLVDLEGPLIFDPEGARDNLKLKLSNTPMKAKNKATVSQKSDQAEVPSTNFSPHESIVSPHEDDSPVLRAESSQKIDNSDFAFPNANQSKEAASESTHPSNIHVTPENSALVVPESEDKTHHLVSKSSDPASNDVPISEKVKRVRISLGNAEQLNDNNKTEETEKSLSLGTKTKSSIGVDALWGNDKEFGSQISKTAKADVKIEQSTDASKPNKEVPSDQKASEPSTANPPQQTDPNRVWFKFMHKSKTDVFVADSQIRFHALQERAAKLSASPSFRLQYIDPDGDRRPLDSQASLGNAIALYERLSRSFVHLFVVPEAQNPVASDADDENLSSPKTPNRLVEDFQERRRNGLEQEGDDTDKRLWTAKPLPEPFRRIDRRDSRGRARSEGPPEINRDKDISERQRRARSLDGKDRQGMSIEYVPTRNGPDYMSKLRTPPHLERTTSITRRVISSLLDNRDTAQKMADDAPETNQISNDQIPCIREHVGPTQIPLIDRNMNSGSSKSESDPEESEETPRIHPGESEKPTRGDSVTSATDPTFSEHFAPWIKKLRAEFPEPVVAMLLKNVEGTKSNSASSKKISAPSESRDDDDVGCEKARSTSEPRGRKKNRAEDAASRGKSEGGHTDARLPDSPRQEPRRRTRVVSFAESPEASVIHIVPEARRHRRRTTDSSFEDRNPHPPIRFRRVTEPAQSARIASVRAAAADACRRAARLRQSQIRHEFAYDTLDHQARNPLLIASDPDWIQHSVNWNRLYFQPPPTHSDYDEVLLSSIMPLLPIENTSHIPHTHRPQFHHVHRARPTTGAHPRGSTEASVSMYSAVGNSYLDKYMARMKKRERNAKNQRDGEDRGGWWDHQVAYGPRRYPETYTDNLQQMQAGCVVFQGTKAVPKRKPPDSWDLRQETAFGYLRPRRQMFAQDQWGSLQSLSNIHAWKVPDVEFSQEELIEPMEPQIRRRAAPRDPCRNAQYDAGWTAPNAFKQTFPSQVVNAKVPEFQGSWPKIRPPARRQEPFPSGMDANAWNQRGQSRMIREPPLYPSAMFPSDRIPRKNVP